MEGWKQQVGESEIRRMGSLSVFILLVEIPSSCFTRLLLQ